MNRNDTLYASLRRDCGEHQYHAHLIVMGGHRDAWLRLAFIPRLAPEEDPVMPLTAAQLRELAAAAVSAAEALEAAAGE